jgi:hypothetical protein
MRCPASSWLQGAARVAPVMHGACACRPYRSMSADDIRADRYNKFRKLGEYREFKVDAGKAEEAEARRNATVGVTTKHGRWAEARSRAIAPACQHASQNAVIPAKHITGRLGCAHSPGVGCATMREEELPGTDCALSFSSSGTAQYSRSRVRALQNEEEAAYWDAYDDATEQWEEMLKEKEHYLLVPAANSRARINTPDGRDESKLSELADAEANPSDGRKKATVGSNGA